MHPTIFSEPEKRALSSVMVTIAFLVVSPSVLHAQPTNLVVNPSFEESVDFQDNSTNKNWSKCLKNDTPDYIEFTSRGEPEFYYSKYIGGLLPYDGEAYAGIFCYRTNPLRGVENIREFIQAPLKETLEKDTLYRISLYIALDPESNTAINNFNIYLGNDQLFFKREKQMFELRPQLRFQQESFDSLSWMELTGNFIAKGNESVIVIGNFRPDNSIGKKRVWYESEMLPKWNLHELERAAYYYIDLVSVVKASSITESGEEEIDDEKEYLTDVKIGEPEPEISLIEIGKVDRDSSIILKNIFFDFDESVLLPASYTELDRLYDQLQQHPGLQIVIEGHTDNMGTFEYNMRLSVDRAKAVVNYLLEKDLNPDRVSYEGFGYTRPLSDNRTEKGRQMNRRVAFRIKEINRQNP
ncbi:MAG: OmpA family protein [Bacteroidales bacterium]